MSKKLNDIFLFTLILIYIHGVEEVMTGFPRVDSFIKIGSSYFSSTPEQFYWITHMIWWVLLPALYVIFHKKRIAIFLFSLFGLFFIVELHHIIKAIYFRSYYPGLVTALIYPFIGVFYWRELVKNWKKGDK